MVKIDFSLAFSSTILSCKVEEAVDSNAKVQPMSVHACPISFSSQTDQDICKLEKHCGLRTLE